MHLKDIKFISKDASGIQDVALWNGEPILSGGYWGEGNAPGIKYEFIRLDLAFGQRYVRDLGIESGECMPIAILSGDQLKALDRATLPCGCEAWVSKHGPCIKYCDDHYAAPSKYEQFKTDVLAALKSINGDDYSGDILKESAIRFVEELFEEES